jgi:hypothetical protein
LRPKRHPLQMGLGEDVFWPAVSFAFLLEGQLCFQ